MTGPRIFVLLKVKLPDMTDWHNALNEHLKVDVMEHENIKELITIGDIPKPCIFVLLKVKLPDMFDWHNILNEHLKFDVTEHENIKELITIGDMNNKRT